MTVNLEKELIRQNRKIATPQELLAINEYEKHAGLLKNDALERVGLTQSLKAGEHKKSYLEQLLRETQKFQKERVFHISQIKAVCDKYYLRFLPSEFYKGTIDDQLPNKIVNFEAAYMVKCKAGNENYYSDRTGNTFIAAPKGSFNLQAKPKDPLFFYKINDEYFYLIHKWGNDISITRRLMSFFSSGVNVNFLLQIVCMSLAVWIGRASGEIFGWEWLVIGLLSVGSTFVVHMISGLIACLFMDEIGMPLDGWFPKNKWDSPYRD